MMENSANFSDSERSEYCCGNDSNLVSLIRGFNAYDVLVRDNFVQRCECVTRAGESVTEKWRFFMAEINAVVTYDPPWSAFSTTLASIILLQLSEAFTSQAIELLQHVVPHAHRPPLKSHSLPRL